MTLVLRLLIPSLPPVEYASNQSRGAAWGRQYRVSHGKRGAAELIMALVKEQEWQGEPLEKAVVTVTFGLPDRRKRDHGGLIERFKPWLDALTRNPDPKTKVWRGAGVLWDDDLLCIGWPVYGDFLSPKNPQTIIEIYEVSNG